MEFLRSIFEIVKDMSEVLGKWYGYHNGLEGNMQNLKRKIADLSNQENDINAEIRSAERQPWKRRKKEVEVWLRNVPQLKDDVQRLEQEVVGERNALNIIPRVRLGKRIIEKVQEAAELQGKGKAFDGLLVDDFPTGLLTPLTKYFVESTEARNVERVWECLMNDGVRQIGIYGMGGVGKTTLMKHIHNRLLEETVTFSAVFWVTVSKASNVRKLQSDIANELNFRLSDDEDERKRALRLYATLSSRKKYVLIIDDLWEPFPLEGVGIPEPNQSNGCKIVVTTRSFDVCRRMDCTAVKVELLTQQEALTLFLRKAVGQGNLLAPEVEEIAIEVAKECSCLPLAIVAVAGSMRGLNGKHDWRNALNELINSKKDASEGESEIFDRLKFSYSRLGDKVLQDCFLYCSLYPEDQGIPAKELIEYWFAEGFIGEMNSVQAKFDKGQAILGKLTSSCLLEIVSKRHGMIECVRLHDLIRDMALRITASSPRFLVKAGERLESIPYEDWSEDLDKISFMGSKIRELPLKPPVWPRLTTLLLNHTHLSEIADWFFTHMNSLKVLDLSSNQIKSLPESISNLENLQALILAHSYLLEYVPSLKKLKALKEFKLTNSRIKELPEGIEELVNLRKLDLSDNERLGMFLSCKLRRLSKLQYLTIDGTRAEVSAEDLLCLRQLKIVAVPFKNLQELTMYVTSELFQGMEKYCLIVGRYHLSILLDPAKSVCISSESVPFGIREDQLVLPANINYFRLDGFDVPTSLSAIPCLKAARDLRKCEILRCQELVSVFSSQASSEDDGQISLGMVESFKLSNLPSFRVLFDGITPPKNIYFNLKKLHLSKCDAVKNVFHVQLLQNFPNLEKLSVDMCMNMEDIIVEKEKSSDWGHHQDDRSTISLPNLKMLNLSALPNLKRIYTGVMVCQSIEKVMVSKCPNVTRLPISLHMDRGQAIAPPALKSIMAEKEWWESLEWDDAFTKTILQPYVR